MKNFKWLLPIFFISFLSMGNIQANTTHTPPPDYWALMKKAVKVGKYIKNGYRVYKVLDTVTGMYMTYETARYYANEYARYSNYYSQQADYYYGTYDGNYYARQAQEYYNAYLYYDWLARNCPD